MNNTFAYEGEILAVDVAPGIRAGATVGYPEGASSPDALVVVFPPIPASAAIPATISSKRFFATPATAG